MVLRIVVLGCCMAAAAVSQAAEPLMCGSLWWMPYQQQASSRDYESFIDSQKAVGFDLLWICGTADLMEKAVQNEKDGSPYDPLEIVLRLADKKSMRVIVDLPQCGWYGKAEPEEVIKKVEEHIQAFWKRYGKHRCLYGWYLNFEINPLVPDEKEESAWWREVWSGITMCCHRVSPHSVVTISPFFLLDDENRRGFKYLTPKEYAAWWEKTLRQTKIDILMLQDSGAEHLGFFTMADREPFLAAMQAACRQAGTRFWVNVESGEADVASWDEFIALEQQKKVPWKFVPIDRLATKIKLASRYGEQVINWGYFPYMFPERVGVEPTTAQHKAYQAYQKYYLHRNGK